MCNYLSLHLIHMEPTTNYELSHLPVTQIRLVIPSVHSAWKPAS